MRCSSAASAAHRSPLRGAPCRGPRFCSRQKLTKLLPGPAADSACDDDRPLTSRTAAAASRSSSRGSGKVNRVRLPLRQRGDPRSGRGSRRIKSARPVSCAAWAQLTKVCRTRGKLATRVGYFGVKSATEYSRCAPNLLKLVAWPQLWSPPPAVVAQGSHITLTTCGDLPARAKVSKV